MNESFRQSNKFVANETCVVKSLDSPALRQKRGLRSESVDRWVIFNILYKLTELKQLVISLPAQINIT